MHSKTVLTTPNFWAFGQLDWVAILASLDRGDLLHGDRRKGGGDDDNNNNNNNDNNNYYIINLSGTINKIYKIHKL